MVSPINVIICGTAALLFWGALGLAFARWLVPASLALPIAPALGWACHSVLALALYRYVGFTAPIVVISSIAAIALAFPFLLPRTAVDDGEPFVRLPIWAYALALLLAVVPALALFPKVSGEGLTLAPAIFDHSKVAIIDEMTRLGLPPGNPFFGEAGRDAPLIYYYLWHFSAAELALPFRASGWEADIAMSGFAAFSSLTLMMGFAAWISGRVSAGIWVVPLCFAASLHPILEWLFGAKAFYSIVLPPTGLAGWLFQTTWAPQHIALTSCVMLACFLLVQMPRRPSPLAALVLGLVAAAGFESSTWVGGIVFGAASAAIGITSHLACPRDARRLFARLSGMAALLALVLSYPLLHDQLLAGSVRDTGFPLAFAPYAVFNRWAPDVVRRVLDIPGYWLVFLVIEFPAIYIPGGIALASCLRLKPARASIGPTTRAFAILMLVGLLTAGYITITFAHNNDLGWRAVLPAVFVLTIFAAIGLSRWLSAPSPLRAALAILLLVLALPKSIQIAAENLLGSSSVSDKAFAESPALWKAVRSHSAPSERIANNPLFLEKMTPWPANISWALFSNRGSCFAGGDLAAPFVPLPRARTQAISEQFVRVFKGEASQDDIRDLATRYECRVVVLSEQDGAWRRDPFIGSGYYKLVEEKAGRWRIYRAVGAPDQAATPARR